MKKTHIKPMSVGGVRHLVERPTSVTEMPEKAPARGQETAQVNSPTSAAKTTPGGQRARATQSRGGVPVYDWVTQEDIDESGAYAVAWCRPSAEQPNGVVQLARDFPAILEVKKNWRDQYPDHLADRIEGIIEEVYGQTMVARIAHSESLVSDPKWGKARVEEELRSQVALTMSLLGLFSEDQLISSRMSGLGVRRRAKVEANA